EIKDERQAERHEHVEGADDQTIRDVEEEKLRHCGRTPLPAIPPPERGMSATPDLVGGEPGGGRLAAATISQWELRVADPHPTPYRGRHGASALRPNHVRCGSLPQVLNTFHRNAR